MKSILRILIIGISITSFFMLPFWITLLFGVGYVLYYQSPEMIAIGIFFDALSTSGEGVHGFTFFFTILFASVYFFTLLLRERFVGYRS